MTNLIGGTEYTPLAPWNGDTITMYLSVKIEGTVEIETSEGVNPQKEDLTKYIEDKVYKALQDAELSGELIVTVKKLKIL